MYGVLLIFSENRFHMFFHLLNVYMCLMAMHNFWNFHHIDAIWMVGLFLFVVQLGSLVWVEGNLLAVIYMFQARCWPEGDSKIVLQIVKKCVTLVVNGCFAITLKYCMG